MLVSNRITTKFKHIYGAKTVSSNLILGLVHDSFIASTSYFIPIPYLVL
jgi:hypothetical protein